jgi:hypothetical protein
MENLKQLIINGHEFKGISLISENNYPAILVVETTRNSYRFVITRNAIEGINGGVYTPLDIVADEDYPELDIKKGYTLKYDFSQNKPYNFVVEILSRGTGFNQSFSDKIEELLDFSDDEVRSAYNSWDKGDCSRPGLVKILLEQVRKEDGKYDYNK